VNGAGIAYSVLMVQFNIGVIILGLINIDRMSGNRATSTWFWVQVVVIFVALWVIARVTNRLGRAAGYHLPTRRWKR
jgi:hypothetical protein